MSNTFTLEDIAAAAEKQFGSSTIPLPDGDVVLRNVARLSDKERKEFAEIQKRMKALKDVEEGEEVDEDSQTAIFEDLLRKVAKTPEQGERLVNALGGDLAMLVATFGLYSKETELGEASASQS